MDVELVSPAVKAQHSQYIEQTAQEYERLRDLHSKVKTSTIKVDETELDGVVRKFEDAIKREKARVDSGLLQLTSTFTKMVHETRNKVYKHLDDQLLVFRDNIQFLRENLTNFKQENVVLPDFDRKELETRLNVTPEQKKIELIDSKHNEITKAKRSVEGIQRQKNHYSALIEKLRTSAQVLQQRNDQSYVELNTKFEEALRVVVDEYRPKGLKQFRKKMGPTTHLDVNYHNYFKAGVTPMIHYFEPQTKNLWIHTIPVVGQTGHQSGLTKKKVELDNEFLIPAYHGSIITPEGRIFLIGGIDDTQKDGTSNARCYEYDPKLTTLIRKSNMAAERFGFAITYSKGKIYVFGGIGKDGNALKTCEVYDIATNKWSALPPMNEASVHACVSVFKDKFIYKFGGYSGDQAQSRTVKRYSIQDKTWSSAEVNYELLYPLSAAAQINANEIFVFGGLREDKKGANRSFVLSVDVDTHNKDDIAEAVTSLGNADLPVGDGFWNPQTIVQQNSLYVLQNVSHGGNVTGRRLLEYRNGTWDILNA